MGTISRFAPGASTLTDVVPSLLGSAERDAASAQGAALVGAGVPAALAERVAHLEALVPSFDIVEIAESEGLDVPSVAEVYFSLGARLELQWLRERIVALSRATRWEAMARAALRDDVYSEQAALTAEVLHAGARDAAARVRVESWLADNRPGVERTLQLLADIRAGGTLDLARLNVAVREIRNLIHASGSPERVPQPAAEPAAAETA
jgi:glutamate dehydrogenase